MRDHRWYYKRRARWFVNDAKYYINNALRNHCSYDLYWQRAALEGRQRYESYTLSKIEEVIHYLKLLS